MSASAQAFNKKPFLGHLFRTTKSTTTTKHMHSSSLSSTRDWTHCHDPYEPPTSLKARQETLDKLCGIITPSASTSTPRRPRVNTTTTPSLRKCASSHNLRRAANRQPPTDDDNMPLAMMVMKTSTSRTRRKQSPTTTTTTDVDDDNIPIALARRRLQPAACY